MTPTCNRDTRTIHRAISGWTELNYLDVSRQYDLNAPKKPDRYFN
jgi:hypothetical protein